MSNTKIRGDRNGFRGLDSDLGPAKPLSPARSKWLVELAVTEALKSPSVERPRVVSIRSIALAAIVVTASAAAASVVRQRYFPSIAKSASAPELAAPATRNGLAHQIATPRITVSSVPVETTAVVPAGDANPLPAATVFATQAPGANHVATVVRVEDRLASANELRRAAQWAAAEHAYLDIATKYAAAPEAKVAALAAASLRLEHLADPAGALELYQSLAGGNALGVEALYGMARCHGLLGNHDAEVAALRSVVDTYPASLQADRARQRLRQIEQTDP